MIQKLREGSCEFYASVGKISKKLPVFYNPDMRINRDICVLLLKSSSVTLNIADILAGSGIRSIRLLKELPNSKIKSISINDSSPESIKLIKKNLKLNRIKSKAVIHNKDANEFLINSSGFNYIDIDPFGSPNPFLDNSIKRLSRDGILAVTATDTSALAGSYLGSCQRKYWAKPLRNELMHEAGIRIMIRKVQLIGAQYEKALTPIFCHSTLHYIRVYFSCKKSKKAVDNILKQHGYLLYCNNCMSREVSKFNKSSCCGKEMDFAGPLWLGSLWDAKLVNEMHKNLKTDDKELVRLLSTIKDESSIPVVGFYSIPKLCKKLKKSVPKQELIIDKIRRKKARASQTHFALNSIRTDIEFKELIKIMKSF